MDFSSGYRMCNPITDLSNKLYHAKRLIGFFTQKKKLQGEPIPNIPATPPDPAAQSGHDALRRRCNSPYTVIHSLQIHFSLVSSFVAALTTEHLPL